MGDVDDVWHDDRLIGALARGEAVDDTDPAVGPLRALARLAESAPAARPLDAVALAGERRNHRYAVRSLAVAVAVVATLSATGVAAVVTGDPLRPAKAVWQQIQHHTAAKADAGDPGLHSDDAVADAVSGREADAAQLRLSDPETVGGRLSDAGDARRHDASARPGPAAVPAAEGRPADGAADGTAHAPVESQPSGDGQRRSDPGEAPAARSEEPAGEADTGDDRQARRSQSGPPPEDQDETPTPAEGPDGDVPDHDAPEGEAPDGEDLEPPIELMRTQEQQDPDLYRDRSGDPPTPGWSGEPRQTPPAEEPLLEPAPAEEPLLVPAPAGSAPAQQHQDDGQQPLLGQPAPE